LAFPLALSIDLSFLVLSSPSLFGLFVFSPTALFFQPPLLLPLLSLFPFPLLLFQPLLFLLDVVSSSSSTLVDLTI
jgi:hypothetical protein